ncbi:MAG TPA: hypothetical protein VMU69_32310 [Bradyrhizobium sp.]|nr:hypothetical protein [Bradyrhizobium sp.]
MRLSQRLIAAAVLIALSSVLVGCSGAGYDPTDLLDWLDTKKKLPGKREPVFPDGVPGLEQGVPKDLYKGAVEQQERADEAAAAAAAAAPPPGAEDASGQKAAGAAAQQGGTGAASEPAKPKRKKIVHRKPKAAPTRQAAQPAQEAQPPAQPAPQSAQQSAAPFPAPLPSGSFAH